MIRPTDVTIVGRRFRRLFSYTFAFALVLQSGALLTVSEHLSFSTGVYGATSITPTIGNGDLGSKVNSRGNLYGITGGTPIGSNLFHSFNQFSVATGDIAQFQTSTLNPTTTFHNILSRVTGGSPSSIFGTIDSATYYPNANLYLMNQAGIVFGPNATLNVGGSVNFTTASYIRFFDGTNSANFYNNPANDAVTAAGRVSILSSAPLVDFGFVTPAAFGFLNSTSAAIAVRDSTLSVPNGQSINLMGGNQGFTYTNPDTGVTTSVSGGVTISNGRLSAPGGQINIASVASSGELSAINYQPDSGMTLGSISISQGSRLDVSADAAGTVRIRAGQLEIVDSTLSADTGNFNGAQTAIDINIKGDISISDTRGLPAITARSTGDGNSGQIDITSLNLTTTSTSSAFFALIDSRAFAGGRGGDVTMTVTDTLNANGGLFLIDSGTAGPGNGGSVTLNANTVHFENAGLSTGDYIARSTNQVAGGAGGNLMITADRLEATNSIFDTSSFFGQTAGNVTLNVHTIIGNGLQIGALGVEGGGGITFNSENVLLTNGADIENDIVSGQGGGITINARTVELSNGSGLVSTTFGDGQAGNITITATDHFTMAGSPADSNPTGLFNNSVGLFGSGNAGSVVVTTPRLEMTGGARINTITEGSGHGGDVIINTMRDISISGEYPFNLPEPIFGIGTIGPSGIFTTTRGSDLCVGPCGNAGNISITAGSVSLGNGAQIDSSTSNNGQGGTITINTSGRLSLSGTLNDGSPVGIFSRTIGTNPDSGNGGFIELHATQFEVTSGAQVSASSLGSGPAGNVTLHGPMSMAQSILIDGGGSGIFTDAQNTGAGGSIAVNANSVTLQNGGTLSASTSGNATSATGGSIVVNAGQVQMNNGASISAKSTGQGDAGNITVNAGTQLVMTGDSSITTSAQSAGGGNIAITASDLVRLVNSKITASVQGGTGNGGNITIDPNAVILQNSQILAQAVQGNGGNITITTPVFLADPSSLVDASSQFGLNGTVNIQSPTSNLSGTVGQLSSKTRQMQALLQNRCAALVGGEQSTFILAGRDTLPAEPGGWMGSPVFAAMGIGEKIGDTAGIEARGARRETGDSSHAEILSLRRMTPPGFLIQAFATDGSTGCHS